MFRLGRFLLASEPLVKCEIVGKIAVLKLNRPKALNALNSEIVTELAENLKKMESNPAVGCIVVTGEGRAFAAGADIKMMAGKKFADVMRGDLFGALEIMKTMQTPTIAAVNGFAFGGGCELAMCCDIIVASNKAQFGQPEIKIGTIPGLGGTQRLTQAIGKSKAMELVLTGEPITAEQAERAGLVSHVVEPEKLMEKAMDIANKIASLSKPIVSLAKMSVLKSCESAGLNEGLAFEKRCFQSTFALADQKEGMTAFAEKRAPNWQDN
jgi:enoyl-CoA hydratase/carnithine racemase